MKKLKLIFKILVYIFAAIGLLFIGVYFAMKFHLTNTAGIVDNQFIQGSGYTVNSGNTSTSTANWAQGEEWQTLKTAISKDVDLVNSISTLTGVPSRIIISPLFVEQIRLYYSEREIFKQFFQPLNILGVQSQFSLGIMGIKGPTAEAIENNLKNPSSPYYLGEKYSGLLDFHATSTQDIETERFNRLTNSKNHYYSYLYTALYIKEIETQWKNAGSDISNKPEIISTLYNIGFEHSNPSANPQVGGAEIDIGTAKYSFGGLAGEFYYSNELTNLFPKGN